jgi:chromosome segregation ATPase
MSETMSHVERVLWRIAELGARCSQQAATGERAALWAELEQTIAGLDEEFEAAGQAVDIAPAQVRSLEGRLKVALQERDREKAKLQEHKADAAAARRERDRALEKARKAIAVTTEAKAAMLEARSTAAECVARASAAENSVRKAMAARDQAIAARNEALAARDHAISDRNKAVNALADALTAGERAADARDKALADRDVAVRALDAAQARIAELEAARTDQDTVVVLPGMTVPEAPVGLDDSSGAEDSGVCRYLNVAATIAGLLPEDLGPYLQPGATVVRREGRLFAVVAINSTRWSEPGADTTLAQPFVDAGFKVEWAAKTPLGV